VKSIVHDPLVSAAEAHEEYGIQLQEKLSDLPPFDAVILAVSHEAFKKLTPEKLAAFYPKKEKSHVLIDVKGFYSPEAAQKAGFAYWRL
jgi:UDP-N-acetyl-D-galactosamine dehydrogenase